MFNAIEVSGSGGPPTTSLEPYKGPPIIHNQLICTPESRALQQSKNEINLFYQEGKWDDYKKITNPYEYIFLSWNRRSSRSVTTRQPLSRSYFKMIELWNALNLSEHLSGLVERDGGLYTAHSAEGPGGFIEACGVMAERKNWEYKNASAITLRSDAKNVPGWRKAARFLTMNPQVVIHDGSDGTGNIMDIDNQREFIADTLVASQRGVHLYTADGGFDFSNDYNAQEDSIFPLLMAEMILGLRTLAKGGCLIVKCFDTTERPTLDLIWLISRCFCTWSIIKPRTSRAGNAERYIVGKGYLGFDASDVLDVLESYQRAGDYSKPILASDMWRTMSSALTSIQEQIEHVEIQVIRDTLALIRNTEAHLITKLVRENVQRSLLWCKEHSEDIAPCWAFEFEKNVAKETLDLMNILNPPQNAIAHTYTTWNRSTISSHLTFEGFRKGQVIQTPMNNPFMRVKTTPTFMN
jgi:23S rRNA U2552 (ribose-2'-O)-methylase RlmE/FtsJ